MKNSFSFFLFLLVAHLVCAQTIPNEIKLSTQEIHLNVGEEYIPEVIFSPQGSYCDVQWETDNNDVISVDKSGRILAKQPGIARAYVWYEDENTNIEDNVIVSVGEITLESITLDENLRTMYLHFSEELRGYLYDFTPNICIYSTTNSSSLYRLGSCRISEKDPKCIETTIERINGSFRYEACYIDENLHIVNTGDRIITPFDYYLTFEENGLYYCKTSDSTVMVFDVNEDISEIVIPSIVTYSGVAYAVTHIRPHIFRKCTNISSISIPENMNMEGSDLCIIKDGIRYVVLNKHSVEAILEPNLGSVEETMYTKNIVISENIVIPSEITAGETFTVVATRADGFSYNYNFTSLNLPENISVSHNMYITKKGIRYNVLNEKEVAVTYDCDSDGNRMYYSGDIVIPSLITAGNTFSVTSISGFNNCTNLTSITIPSTVTKVSENAFAGCTKLKDVTCLAATPPEAYANSFENYNGYLHIPCESKDDYDFANCWGSFKHVECIGAEIVELTKDEVAVEPEKNSAVFSMPINESANSYTLTIQNNGATFCTLMFNAQGQLSNIDFSTTKSYELKVGVSGYQFTVTGLSEATNYGYSFKAFASNKSVLKEYAGAFTTKNADGTGGNVSGGGEGTLAVDNISENDAITIVNNQILVNGEAPAFVVSISGKKIANQNLKSGVYFAMIEEHTIKIVIE